DDAEIQRQSSGVLASATERQSRVVPAFGGSDSVTLESPAAIAGRLVDQLVAALVNARIYAPSHPRLQTSFAAVQRHVRDLAELWRENPVRIGAVDGLLFFQQRPLLSASLAAARLLGKLQMLGAGGRELGA